ncbi:MAG TPA: ATP-binding cassette domain-containing protein, partial [Acetobacteraceae bacterium]|nr:ATP-binding cassette domain-containing protein [Acetobacteraceae bacterium]
MIANPAPVLSVRAIGKSFGAVEVLHGISLDLRAGEIHALVGENGAGKSTLMRIMAGYLPPASGQLLMHGLPLVLHSGADGEHHGVVLLHQELNLAEDLTVEESIFLGREWRRGWLLDKQRMRNHTAQLLAVLHCEIPPTTPIRALTVSQRQMVEIGKA